uniref:Integrase catalytic domain-containing protein n=1 Tax=Cacopsylla melanoneura TaxID=428564 RepID=A0A8D8U8Y0_9HEMI
MRVYGTKVSLLDKANKVWDLHLSVTPTIVGEDKSEYFDMKMINNLASTYTLADECFTSGIEQNYDILIGNDYYLQFVIGDRVQIQDNLFLLNTVFGHVFSGQLFVPRDSGDNHMTNFASISLFLKADTPLLGPQNLNFFWDLETLGIKENPCESEDDLALRNFERDLKCVNNRYYVSFPWRDVSKCDVQTNYGLALGRLGSLLKRHKDDGLLDICDKTFLEQVKLGVIERVESDSQKVGNYLPFHAVRKETSETTKVRLVMDASAKQVRSKPSLNELLYRGITVLVWCLLFTCLTTRAIHLELVDTETSVDLFMAFRKFIARRGGCTTLLSDNAQQFKLLKKAVDSIYSFNDFQSYLNQKKIVFKFTSPLTPWAGGTFERLISVTKQCIRKALGKGLISYSQLETILTEVQYMVNDRPLGYVSNEDLIITPNHFLCLKRDSLLPDIASSCESVPGSVTFKNLINLWKKGNNFLNVFWRAWHNQYLMSLRERNNLLFKQGKVMSIVPNVGDVVLLKQTNQTRSSWPYGVIVSINHSRDNKVRIVEVRLSNGQTVVRPVSLLFPFEFGSNC